MSLTIQGSIGINWSLILRWIDDDSIIVISNPTDALTVSDNREISSEALVVAQACKETIPIPAGTAVSIDLSTIQNPRLEACDFSRIFAVYILNSKTLDSYGWAPTVIVGGTYVNENKLWFSDVSYSQDLSCSSSLCQFDEHGWEVDAAENVLTIANSDDVYDGEITLVIIGE